MNSSFTPRRACLIADAALMREDAVIYIAGNEPVVPPPASAAAPGRGRKPRRPASYLAVSWTERTDREVGLRRNRRTR